MNLARDIPAESIECFLGEDGFLGKGGFGCVQLCKLAAYGIVAVKCCGLRGSKKQLDQCKANVEKELQAVLNANHANVVCVYGVTRWKCNIGIVMEFLPGGSLSDLVLDLDVIVLPMLLRMRICLEISNGLAYLHNFQADMRMTHGDVKLQNCLLTSNLNCKIADFGSARISSYTGQTMMTRVTDPAPRTKLYCAPERTNNANVTTSMDAYSYGLTGIAVLVRSEELLVHAGDARKRQKMLAENLPDEDPSIVSFLVEVMESTLCPEPRARASMQQVRDRISDKFSRQCQVRMSQNVTQVLRHFSVYHPSTDGDCVPLSTMVIDASGQICESSGSSRGNHSSRRNVPGQRGFSISRETGDTVREMNQLAIGSAPEPSIEEIFTGEKDNLREELKSAKVLALKYEASFANDQASNRANDPATAAEMVTTVTSAVRQYVTPSAEKVETFAELLLDQQRHLPAIFFNQVAANLYASSNNLRAATGISNCCIGIRDATEAVIELNIASADAITSRILPIFENLREMVERLTGVDNEDRVACATACIGCISNVQHELKMYGEREQTCLRGLQLFESNFPPTTCRRYRVYANLLHNLGCTCFCLGRLNDAAEYFRRAANAKKWAEDYNSAGEKQSQIKMSKLWLQQVNDERIRLLIG